MGNDVQLSACAGQPTINGGCSEITNSEYAEQKLEPAQYQGDLGAPIRVPQRAHMSSCACSTHLTEPPSEHALTETAVKGRQEAEFEQDFMKAYEVVHERISSETGDDAEGHQTLETQQDHSAEALRNAKALAKVYAASRRGNTQTNDDTHDGTELDRSSELGTDTKILPPLPEPNFGSVSEFICGTSELEKSELNESERVLRSTINAQENQLRGIVEDMERLDSQGTKQLDKLYQVRMNSPALEKSKADIESRKTEISKLRCKGKDLIEIIMLNNELLREVLALKLADLLQSQQHERKQEKLWRAATYEEKEAFLIFLQGKLSQYRKNQDDHVAAGESSALDQFVKEKARNITPAPSWIGTAATYLFARLFNAYIKLDGREKATKDLSDVFERGGLINMLPHRSLYDFVVFAALLVSAGKSPGLLKIVASDHLTQRTLNPLQFLQAWFFDKMGAVPIVRPENEDAFLDSLRSRRQLMGLKLLMLAGCIAIIHNNGKRMRDPTRTNPAQRGSLHHTLDSLSLGMPVKNLFVRNIFELNAPGETPLKTAFVHWSKTRQGRPAEMRVEVTSPWTQTLLDLLAETEIGKQREDWTPEDEIKSRQAQVGQLQKDIAADLKTLTGVDTDWNDSVKSVTGKRASSVRRGPTSMGPLSHLSSLVQSFAKATSTQTSVLTFVFISTVAYYYHAQKTMDIGQTA